MTSKHWTLVGGAVACLSTFSLAAAPWLEPGDPRARYAVQKLADRGHMNRSVTTWPMMWSALEAGNQTSIKADQPSVGLASAYLRFEKEEQAKPGFRGEFSASAQSEIPAITGFSNNNLTKAGTSLNLQWLGDTWALGLNPAYTNNPDDDEEFRLDGSYLAATASNWVFGAGAIDRWWGPGWQSSLILSNNARPIPSVWINRNDTRAFETPWLSWIGPWQFTVMAGQYESDRAVPDAKFIGMRFTFRPVDGLDIGLSRALMVGGEGRPEDASTLWDALIGRDNSQDGPENDPGNQLGSIDIRYGFAVGEQSMSLYTQMMGEDEAGAFPAKKSWMFGGDWTSQLLNSEQQWFVEYTNTLADDVIGSAAPNVSYEHFQYRSGYRHYGRNMATGFDGDAEAVTLGAYHFLDNGSNLTAKASYAELNKDGGNRTVVTNDNVFYTAPIDSQHVAILDLGYGTQAFAGWLDLTLQVTDKKIEYISGKKDQWSAGASWTYRF
ncbi:capsule assembly Wzi family protein [Marinobacter halophilus]|uniref:Capsule assembly Wzi family protein n=1 Tax=Marinobacter halophilus TaxID=1323740 RepID=A0A2T1KDD7_9GAMM|nr:capsule assembly Wzi family protein [Marinobacter halophilus]PSF07773.1 capsule assembly Wzi family protein [Marinobacter halophilus]GGC56933.1 outer membrane protein in capsule/EPS biosynthesis locus [Marinobacter halophilus]